MTMYGPAAAALVIGLGLGAYLHPLPGTGGASYVKAALVKEMRMRPTAAAPAARGMAMLVRSGNRQEIIISVHGLRPLPAGESYNVWLVHGHTHRLAGMLTVDAAGDGALSAAVPQGVAFGYVGITREPRLHDLTPWGPRILGAPLANS